MIETHLLVVTDKAIMAANFSYRMHIQSTTTSNNTDAWFFNLFLIGKLHTHPVSLEAKEEVAVELKLIGNNTDARYPTKFSSIYNKFRNIN